MNALVADAPGPGQAPQIARVAVPEPGPGQVRVRVQAAALNPLDSKIASGTVGLRRAPNILGFDAAGSVDAVGEGVHGYRVGDPVLALTIANGSLAELVVVDAGPYLTLIPAGLSLEAAAALPSAGASAATLIQAAELRNGDQVLVIGASGGLGTFTVQLAVQAGAHVLATGREDDLELLRTLGASEAIDYRGRPLAQSVLDFAPNGVDVIIDLVHAGPDLVEAANMASVGGRIISPLSGPRDMPRQVTATYPPVHPLPAGLLSHLAHIAAKGELAVITDIRGTLADADRVLAQFDEEHRRGKWILVAATTG